MIPISVTGSFLSLATADWLSFILAIAVKGLMVCALALLITGLLHKSNAAILSLIGTITFAVMLLVPFSIVNLQDRLIVLQIHESCAPAQSAVSRSGTGTPVAKSSLLPAALPADETLAQFETRSAHSFTSLPILLVCVWLLGIGLLAAKSLIQLLLFRRSLSRALPLHRCTDQIRILRLTRLASEIGADLKLPRPVRIRLLPGEPIPFVWGFHRPVLHLPAAALAWDEARLRVVLCHELAHLKRGDLYRLLLIDLVCICYWFNPLLWRVADNTKLAIESACDDYVLAAGTDCHAYARQLLWFASQLGSRKSLAPSIPAMAKLSSLESRLVQILNPRRSCRGASPLRTTSTALLAALVLIPLASISMVDKNLSASPCIEVIDQIDVPLQSSTIPGTAPQHSVHRQVADVHQPTRSEAANRFQKPRYSSGDHAIHLAAIAGDASEVERLLTADPGLLDIRNRDWMTPLALAAWHDQLPLVKQLIARGAALDVKNRNGLTPLFSALDRGRSRTAALFIDNDANINVTGFRQRTPLHMAARAGDSKNAARLIQIGAEINRKDSQGAAPISLASRNRHDEVVNLLLRHGADPEDIVPGRPLPESKPRGTSSTLPR